MISKYWKLLAVAGLLATAAIAQQDLNMEISGFRVPEYDDQGVMTSQLFGDKAEMEPGGPVKITTLRVEFYKEGKTIAKVQSPYCFYDQKKREAKSDAPVSADMERLQMRGKGFELKSDIRTVHVLNDCRVMVQDVTQQMDIGVPAVTKGKNTNDVTVITSDEMFLDYKTRTVRFERNVHVTDPKMEMYCDKLTLRFSEKHGIDWIESTTGVRILYEGKEATAQQATYDAKTDQFVLEGNPKIVDGRNVLMGERIKFWREDMRMVCEPSARLVIYNNSSNGFKTDIFGK